MRRFSLFAQADPLKEVAAEHFREAGTVALIVMIAKLVLPILFFLFLAWVLFVWFMKGKIVRTVQPHQRAIKIRRGRFKGLRRPGLVWMFPFLDRVEIITLSMLEVQIKEETLRTKPEEGYFLKLYGNVFYQINGAAEALQKISDTGNEDPAELVKNILAFHYSVDDLRKLIERLAKDHLRSVVAKKSLSEIFSEKDAIASDLQNHLSEALKSYGVLVVKTPITDVVLSDEVVAASNKRLTAEREGEAAIISAEKAGEALVKKALKQMQAEELAGQGAAKRYEETTRGLAAAVKALTGEELCLSAAGAVGLILEAERYRTFGNLAISGNGPATVFLPYTPGMSDETLSTITAIVGSAPAERHDDGFDYDEHEAALEEALLKARKEDRKDLIELLEKQKEQMRKMLLQATEAAGTAAANATGRIPFVGKRIAKGVRTATEKAAAKLDGV